MISNWLAAMWAIPPKRVAAAQQGRFTLGDMLRWAARAPHEVPLLNEEYCFITDLAE